MSSKHEKRVIIRKRRTYIFSDGSDHSDTQLDSTLGFKPTNSSGILNKQPITPRKGRDLVRTRSRPSNNKKMSNNVNNNINFSQNSKNSKKTQNTAQNEQIYTY